jgi:DNA-binding NarL/FixJ family response regulator
MENRRIPVFPGWAFSQTFVMKVERRVTRVGIVSGHFHCGVRYTNAGIGGIELTVQMRQRLPNVKICTLTTADQPDTIKEAIRAEVDGYVLKSAERTELENALKTLPAVTNIAVSRC